MGVHAVINSQRGPCKSTSVLHFPLDTFRQFAMVPTLIPANLNEIVPIRRHRLGEGGAGSGTQWIRGARTSVGKGGLGWLRNRSNLRWRSLGTATWALALAITFLVMHHGQAQQAELSPERTREALRYAIEFYKTQDYEQAAGFFDRARKGQSSLSPADRKDLTEISMQNDIALKGRQDGRRSSSWRTTRCGRGGRRTRALS